MLARGAVRRPPPARADDAGDLRRDARAREVPARRDLARGRRAQLDAAWACRSGASCSTGSTTGSRSPSRRATRPQRWLPGRLRGRPERRPDPARGRPGGPRAHDRLHRPPRPAQGPAGAAHAPGRTSTGARARGCGSSAPTRSPCGCCSRATASPSDGIDVLGFLSQEELTARAARGEGARRAVARAGELRHGADARVRLRDAGRRVRHPRVQGRHDRRDRRARPARRRRRARRGARRTCSRTSRGGARSASARGSSRSSATRGTRSPSGSRRSTTRSRREVRPARLPRSPWTRGRRSRSRSSPASARCSGGTGRTGATSGTPSPPSTGSGSPPRSGSTCSRSSRARLAWDTVIDPAMPPPHPRFALVFSAFSRRAARERGAAGPRRRARARRGADAAAGRPPRAGLGDARRHGLRAPRLRPHPGRAARRLGAARRRRSRTGRSRASSIVLAIGVVLFLFAFATRAAPRHTRLEGLGTVRRVVTMARLRARRHAAAPAAAALAILVPVRRLGAASCSRSGRRCARSTSTSRCRRPGSCCC